MGWSRGVEILEKLADVLNTHKDLLGATALHEIAVAIIEVLEDNDADTLDEARGHYRWLDKALDAAFEGDDDEDDEDDENEDEDDDDESPFLDDEDDDDDPNPLGIGEIEDQ